MTDFFDAAQESYSKQPLRNDTLLALFIKMA